MTGYRSTASQLLISISLILLSSSMTPVQYATDIQINIFTIENLQQFYSILPIYTFLLILFFSSQIHKDL